MIALKQRIIVAHLERASFPFLLQPNRINTTPTTHLLGQVFAIYADNTFIGLRTSTKYINTSSNINIPRTMALLDYKISRKKIHVQLATVFNPYF